jgi:hypothetical protein
MLYNQEAGLMQHALDTSQQLPLATTPSWMWNSSRPISDTDWFSRYISTLKTRTEMVLETLFFFSPLNHLTWLVAQKYFIIRNAHKAFSQKPWRDMTKWEKPTKKLTKSKKVNYG